MHSVASYGTRLRLADSDCHSNISNLRDTVGEESDSGPSSPPRPLPSLSGSGDHELLRRQGHSGSPIEMDLSLRPQIWLVRVRETGRIRGRPRTPECGWNPHVEDVSN
jgi:hypothetical protein